MAKAKSAPHGRPRRGPASLPRRRPNDPNTSEAEIAAAVQNPREFRGELKLKPSPPDCLVTGRKWDTSYARATKFVLNKWLLTSAASLVIGTHAARPCQTTSRGDRGWGRGRVPPVGGRVSYTLGSAFAAGFRT
jgi:hypothetical protein